MKENTIVSQWKRSTNNMRFLTSAKCIAALVEAALCITHSDDQMLEVYRVCR